MLTVREETYSGRASATEAVHPEAMWGRHTAFEAEIGKVSPEFSHPKRKDRELGIRIEPLPTKPLHN